MTDVALSILALIAGGLVLEVFAASRPSLASREEAALSLGADRFDVLEDFPSGNPS